MLIGLENAPSHKYGDSPCIRVNKNVTEVFEYLVNDNTSFLSAHDILDWVAGMTCPLWDGYQDMLPKNSEGEEEYIPWGELSSNDKAFIDKKVLLIPKSQRLKELIIGRVIAWLRKNLILVIKRMP